MVLTLLVGGEQDAEAALAAGLVGPHADDSQRGGQHDVVGDRGAELVLQVLHRADEQTTPGGMGINIVLNIVMNLGMVTAINIVMNLVMVIVMNIVMNLVMVIVINIVMNLVMGIVMNIVMHIYIYIWLYLCI